MKKGNTLYKKRVLPLSVLTKAQLDLLVHAFVFVIVAIIFTLARHTAYVLNHLVLIECERTGIGVGILVVVIEFT